MTTGTFIRVRPRQRAPQRGHFEERSCPLGYQVCPQAAQLFNDRLLDLRDDRRNGNSRTPLHNATPITTRMIATIHTKSRPSAIVRVRYASTNRVMHPPLTILELVSLGILASFDDRAVTTASAALACPFAHQARLNPTLFPGAFAILANPGCQFLAVIKMSSFYFATLWTGSPCRMRYTAVRATTRLVRHLGITLTTGRHCHWCALRRRTCVYADTCCA